MTRTWVALAVTIAGGAAAAAFLPAQAVAPGRLASGHAPLQGRCFDCHAPFAGPARDRCVRCHVPARIGVALVDGRPLAEGRRPRRAVPGLHASLGAVECSTCHLEHRDRLRAGARLRFTHAALPDDVVARCESCHAADRPAGKLHAQASGACSACHSRERWKPASFEHGRFFRFDGHHTPRCADCHPAGGGYGAYRCDGCHEHDLARERRRHRRVNEADLAACARCHRSANEHEALGGDAPGGAREGAAAPGGSEEDDD